MNGVLVVDKPAGPTSHDVVARVRRAIGISRIGHTGTLDPLATGVLVLAVGRATRLAQFLSGDEKEYVAGVRLGWSTATYDAEDRSTRLEDGSVVVAPAPAGAPAVTDRALLECLAGFTGTFQQMPPPSSAKKVAGTPAYLLARLRKDVELKPAEVTVSRLDLLRSEAGLVTLRIVCSAGFYVRSLAHDIGQRLGCGAHLESLRRTRAGEFHESAATPLSRIRELGPAALAKLIPVSELLSPLPGVVVNEQGARRAAHGNLLGSTDLVNGAKAALQSGSGARVRVLDGAGALLAIGQIRDGGFLQPVVVLV